MKGISPEWIGAIVAWAREEPRIAAVYLFGSRVKAPTDSIVTWMWL